MRSIDQFATEKLSELDALALRRSLVEADRATFPIIERHGRRLISFSCNDYHGLAADPRIKAAAADALQRYGLGGGASRLVTGNHPLYRELEQALAAFKHTEAACVFGSGYLANMGVLGVVAGPRDLVLIDERAHACLYAGAALSKAVVVRFAHNDAEAVTATLAATRRGYRHAIVVTETIFSMDGDGAPISALAAAAAAHDAWLMLDDAHGLGTLTAEPIDAALQMGTLSKALGSYGGYCCASQPVVDLLKTRARPLIYTTSLPPPVLAGALAALAILVSKPERLDAPRRKAATFAARLGLPAPAAAIVPLVLGTPERALAASAALAEAGFLVTAIRPPTVPIGTARLRFAFCAQHEDHDIERLAEAVTGLPGVAQQIRTDGATPCPASL